ncbi:MAG: GDP-mannose 4,6-dehydratase [Deinococcota bacterium]
MKHVLVTGGAGFIGSHLVRSLLAEGSWQVDILDNFDPFYDLAIKENNIAQLVGERCQLIRGDISDAALLASLEPSYDVIVHLAAKAGVRPSLADPVGYQKANVEGTQTLLEFAKDRGIQQFVFASSSSVYGINPDVPWREDGAVLKPISPYASTKVSGELLGHVYSHLYDIRFLALRFFTVYGPGQRPDLAIHKFARLMAAGQPISMYGDGSSRRDYTFVADTIQGIRAAMDYDGSMFEVINLGNNQTVSLREMIETLEHVLDTPAIIEKHPNQPGDVPQTWADITQAKELLGYDPKTTFAAGMKVFTDWFTSQG